jgi:hypothetical protein
MVLDHRGTQVTIEGNVSRDVLTGAASSLHTARPEELAALQSVPKVIAPEPGSTTPGWVIGDRTPVGGGTLSDGTTWAVALATTANGSIVIELDGALGRSATTPLPTNQPLLTSIATSDFTAIVGSFDPAAPGGTLRITYSDGARSMEVQVPAIVVDGLAKQIEPVALATFAFVETGGYQAELLDASGALLASLRG